MKDEIVYRSEGPAIDEFIEGITQGELITYDLAEPFNSWVYKANDGELCSLTWKNGRLISIYSISTGRELLVKVDGKNEPRKVWK